MIIIFQSIVPNEEKNRKAIKKEKAQKNERKREKGQCYYPFTTLVLQSSTIIFIIESLLFCHFHILVGIFHYKSIFPCEERMMETMIPAQVGMRLRTKKKRGQRAPPQKKESGKEPKIKNERKERRDNVTILFPHLCFKVAP